MPLILDNQPRSHYLSYNSTTTTRQTLFLREPSSRSSVCRVVVNAVAKPLLARVEERSLKWTAKSMKLKLPYRVEMPSEHERNLPRNQHGSR